MKIKTIILNSSIAGIMVIIGACRPNRAPHIREQIITAHDSLMGEEDQAVTLKMQLDSLAWKTIKAEQPGLDTTAKQTELKALTGLLNRASDDMSDWMHRFDPELKGKSDDEAAQYYQNQAEKVNLLDKEYRKAINQTTTFLKNLHVDLIKPKAGSGLKM
jgi:hypothetical protein